MDKWYILFHKRNKHSLKCKEIYRIVNELKGNKHYRDKKQNSFRNQYLSPYLRIYSSYPTSWKSSVVAVSKAYRSHLLCSVCFFLMLTANEHKPLSWPGWTCPSQLWVSQQKLNFMYYCGKSKSSGHASKTADFPPYYFAPTGLSLWCYLVFFLINPFEVKIYRMDLFFNIAILFIFSCPK